MFKPIINSCITWKEKKMSWLCDESVLPFACMNGVMVVVNSVLDRQGWMDYMRSLTKLSSVCKEINFNPA